MAIGLDYCSSRCLGCDTKGSLKINEQKSVYADYQYLNLQEAPGSVPPGRVPRYKEVMLTGDLIDRVRPGELVDIIGIYELKSNILQKTNGFPIFNTTIVANSIIRRFGVASSVLSEADKHMVLELSKDPKVNDLCSQFTECWVCVPYDTRAPFACLSIVEKVQHKLLYLIRRSSACCWPLLCVVMIKELHYIHCMSCYIYFGAHLICQTALNSLLYLHRLLQELFSPSHPRFAVT